MLFRVNHFSKNYFYTFHLFIEDLSNKTFGNDTVDPLSKFKEADEQMLKGNFSLFSELIDLFRIDLNYTE